MTEHHPSRAFCSAHSPERKARCRLEDILARLSQVEACGEVIRTQAWNRGNWAAVGIEAGTILKQVGDVRDELSAVWDELTAVIRGEA